MSTDNPELQGFGPPENANAIQLDCWRRQQLFLAAYQKHGIAATAADETGIPIGTVDYWENQDTQGFKKRRELAGQSALGVIEAEIHRRGVEGIEKKFFDKDGNHTGSTWQYSDNLLMFRAKRLDPEYRDTPRVSNQGITAPVTQIIINLAPGVEMPETLIVEGKSREVEDG